jgi:uncharacterized RDD family membrane protein YckC
MDANKNIATIGSRIAGAFIDWVLISIATIPCAFLLSFLLQKNLNNYISINGVDAAYQTLGILAWLITDVIYTIALQSSKSQSTIGQRAFGNKLIKIDGSRPSFADVTLRCLISFVSSAFFKLGYLMVIFRKDRQTLHDYVAGTLVISSHEASNADSYKRPSSAAILMYIALFIGAFILWSAFPTIHMNAFSSASSTSMKSGNSEWVFFEKYVIKGKDGDSPLKRYYDAAQIKKLSSSNYLVVMANEFDEPTDITLNGILIKNVVHEKKVSEFNCITHESRFIESNLYSSALLSPTQVRLTNTPIVGDAKWDDSPTSRQLCPLFTK